MIKDTRQRIRPSRIRRPLLGAALALTAVGALPGVAGAASSPYAREIMTEPSLTSWWRLGETGPTTFDWKRGYDGRFGEQVGRDVPGAIAGDSDGAADFFGAVPDLIWESHVSTPLWLAANAYSLEAWVNPRTLDDRSRRIFSAEQSSSGGTLLAARTSGLVFSRYVKARTEWRQDPVTFDWAQFAVPADWDTLTVPLATGAWTHVVATYDGAVMRLYTNGTLAGQIVSDLDLRQIGGQLTIGATVRGWLEWDGRIDEAALYRGPLSARQVADHHLLGSAPPAGTLAPGADDDGAEDDSADAS